MLLTISSNDLGAQINTQNSKIVTQQRLMEYFKLPREQVYLQLNKSVFFEGETLWFKGYIFDLSHKKPSIASKNIEIGLYDKEGSLVIKDLFYAEQGRTRGQFVMDSIFRPGEYYIHATTNWSRNFKEGHGYVQKIKILGKQEGETVNDGEVTLYDLQFMPEGGHLIAEVENSVGVLLKDAYGRGVPFRKGTVFDDRGKRVTTFNGNRFGIGSFLLNASKSSYFTAKVVLENGRLIESGLPSLENQGLALRVVNTPSKGRFVEIRTNLHTYREIEGNPFFIMYHQNGKSSVGEISFSEGNLMVRAQIRNENLYDGVNTLTLFDADGQPLLERLIFKDSKFLETHVSLESFKNERSGDSISFHFSSNKKQLNTIENLNLSVSVLPSDTKSYGHNTNIIHSFLLQPYLKGYVENPDYYFSEPSNKKFYDLDLLLLTQGWSRYEWDDIFTSPPKVEYEFERGISIRTLVQKDAFFQSLKNQNNGEESKEVSFYLHQTENQEPVVVPVSDDNRVRLDNLFYTHGDTLKYSIVNPNGKLFKSMADIEIRPALIRDKLEVPKHLASAPYPASSGDDLSGSLWSELNKDVIILDEVVVAKDTVPRKNSNYNPVKYSRETEYQIDVDAVRTFPLLIDLIRFKGFRVIYNPLTFEVKITQSFPTLSFGSLEYLAPIVFFDGARIGDFSMFVNMRTDEVETLYANPRDVVHGMRGAGGAIRITSRKTAIDYSQLDHSKVVENFRELPIKFPFTKPKTFYTPIYTNYDSTIFDHYGTIHWEPDITFDDQNGFVISTVYIPNKKYNFYFEGVGEMGKLLSSKITVDFDQYE